MIDLSKLEEDMKHSLPQGMDKNTFLNALINWVEIRLTDLRDEIRNEIRTELEKNNG